MSGEPWPAPGARWPSRRHPVDRRVPAAAPLIAVLLSLIAVVFGAVSPASATAVPASPSAVAPVPGRAPAAAAATPATAPHASPPASPAREPAAAVSPPASAAGEPAVASVSVSAAGEPAVASAPPAAAAAAPQPREARSGTVSPADQAQRVAVIGVPGLRWGDLDPERTPNLWQLATEGAVASLSTRTIPPEGTSVNCPVAGWLTVSAGQRAAAPGPGCPPAPEPVRAADGSATVPGWSELAALQRSSAYQASIGLLGQAITAAGGRVAAVGPGAALAAADQNGRVATYARTPGELPDLTPYAAVFAEAGEIARAWWRAGQGRAVELDDAARATAVRAADRTVGELLRHLPPETLVLVAGLSDAGSLAHLHVAIALGPGRGEPYWRSTLTAASTRQDALVTITDVTATVTHVLGLPTPEGAVGRPWRPAGPAPEDPVAELAAADLAGQVLREIRPSFYTALVIVQLAFYGIAAAVVRRFRRMLTAVQVVAVVSGAVPVATFLAQLVPWWSAGRPMLALNAVILGFAVLIAGLAFAGPWRRHVLGPLTVVAGVSSLTLLIDVMTGSHLQVNAVTGYEPVTGGRFYGFGNIAFAVFATGTILFLAGLWRLRGGLLRPVVLGYALFAIVVDGWPGWGADFGGVPSFVLGVAVFALLAFGLRISPGRLGLIALGGAVLIAALSVADWLRPADRRTHLGAFVDRVLAGEGWPIVTRKLSAMLNTLGNVWLTLLALVAVAFLFLVLHKPSRWGASALSQAYGRAPELRAGLFGALATAICGFVLNDSGIAIPAMALTVAVPLTLAAAVRALRLGPPTTADRSSAESARTAPPTP